MIAPYRTPTFNRLDDCSQWFGTHWAIYAAHFFTESEEIAWSVGSYSLPVTASLRVGGLSAQ